MLAGIPGRRNADLVRENLKKFNGKKKGRQLNYRLSTFPYRMFVSYIDL